MILVTDYIAYFESIATLHKNIRHNLNGQKRFTSISMEDLFANLTHNVQFETTLQPSNYAVMFLEDITGRVRGGNTGNLNDEPDGAFTIMKQCPQEDFAREKAIYDECKRIAFSILGTMTTDYENNTNNVMKYFEPQNGVNYDKIGPMFDNCFGIRVQFSFSRGIILKHNPSDYVVLEP